MRLLSQKLVSLEYRDQLRMDLARAAVCRFLVGYVSADGLNAIGRHLLVRALRNERSFGVSSLTCACGYTPLLNLQDELGDGCVRLKYFMDPLVEGSDEPNEITLFHSKLVYLLLEREQKSVVYVGSHNWSGRALPRPHTPVSTRRRPTGTKHNFSRIGVQTDCLPTGPSAFAGSSGLNTDVASPDAALASRPRSYPAGAWLTSGDLGGPSSSVTGRNALAVRSQWKSRFSRTRRP